MQRPNECLPSNLVSECPVLLCETYRRTGENGWQAEESRHGDNCKEVGNCRGWCGDGECYLLKLSQAVKRRKRQRDDSASLYLN